MDQFPFTKKHGQLESYHGNVNEHLFFVFFVFKLLCTCTNLTWTICIHFLANSDVLHKNKRLFHPSSFNITTLIWFEGAFLIALVFIHWSDEGSWCGSFVNILFEKKPKILLDLDDIPWIQLSISLNSRCDLTKEFLVALEKGKKHMYCNFDSHFIFLHMSYSDVKIRSVANQAHMWSSVWTHLESE